MALALSHVPQIPNEKVLVGNSTADDAGVYQISDDRALLHTVDLLSPVVDDPYTFGRIAAVNSLSDVFAMGGEPLVALSVASFPGSGDPEMLGEIIRGGQDEAVKAGAAMIGGHTFQDAEIRYGLAITGEISPKRIITNAGAQEGDLLILTKALGTGIASQALVARGIVPDRLYQAAVDSMTMSNGIASRVMLKYDVHACTDITGFGLLGHCGEMAIGSGMGFTLNVDSLNLLPLVSELVNDGITNSGFKMNRNAFEDVVLNIEDVPDVYQQIVFSSETSGGLLISIPEKEAERLLRNLRDEGLDNAAIIGEVSEAHGNKIQLKFDSRKIEVKKSF